MKYIVEGTFVDGKQTRKFVKEIDATSETRAKELAYQKIGADHHIGRSKVKIGAVGRLEDGK